MTIFYALAMFGFVLSNYGLAKAYQSIGSEPIPGAIELLCNVLGGPLSTLSKIGLFIAGFFHLSWWEPLVIAPFAKGAVVLTFQRFPLGANYALGGFLFGAVFAVLWMIT